jgi:hypothetical protein
VSGGTMENFINNLCAKLSTVPPHANSPSPELALEFAPPIHPGDEIGAQSFIHADKGQEAVLESGCNLIRVILPPANVAFSINLVQPMRDHFLRAINTSFANETLDGLLRISQPSFCCCPSSPFVETMIAAGLRLRTKAWRMSHGLYPPNQP